LTQHEEKSLLSGSHADDWEEIAVDYLDGTLSARLVHAVEGHIAECSSCREKMEENRLSLAALSGQPLAAPPSELQSAVFSGLRAAGAYDPSPGEVADARPQPSVTRSFWSSLLQPLRTAFGGRHRAVWIPAAAAIVLVAIGVAQLGGDLTGADDALLSPASAPDSPADEGEAESFALEADEGAEARDRSRAAGEETGPAGIQEQAPPGTGDLQVVVIEGGSAGSVAETAERVESLTGLRATPLDEWPGWPTYLARVRPGEVGAVVDVLNREGLTARDETDPSALPYLSPQDAAALPLLEATVEGGFSLTESEEGAEDSPEATDTTLPGEVALLLVIAGD
jgi:anti-sigma factor RsiW